MKKFLLRLLSFGVIVLSFSFIIPPASASAAFQGCTSRIVNSKYVTGYCTSRDGNNNRVRDFRTRGVCVAGIIRYTVTGPLRTPGYNSTTPSCVWGFTMKEHGIGWYTY